MDYLELSFETSAGSIASSGNTGPIQARFSKTNWSPFNELNDYSYDATATSYSANDKITLYSNGTLVWGTEPTSATTTQSNEDLILSTAKLFPNPANYQVSVEMDEELEDLDVKILNLNGTVVTKNSAKELNIEALSTGLYIVEITNPKTQKTVRKRLVIKR